VELPRGLWAPALTPLDAEGRPDPVRLASHGRRLLAQGCGGLLVFGSTGEAPSFSVEEREDLLAELVAAGLPTERLMVGTGCCALPDTARLSAHAVKLGCQHVLALPPFYFKPVSADGLFAAFAEVVERVGDSGLRLLLYNFPRLSGVEIPLQVLERLRAAYPAIVAGVKDSSGDWLSTRGFLDAAPDLAVFPGTERLLRQAVAAGAAGCITATANVNAVALRGLLDAAKCGDDDLDVREAEALALRQRIEALPMVPALKALLARETGDPGWLRVRPPFTAVNEATVADATTGEALLRTLEASAPVDQ